VTAPIDRIGSSVRYLGRAHHDVWDRLVADEMSVLPFQTPRWLDCVCAAGHWNDASRLYESADGRLLILPLATRRARPEALAVHASLPPGWGTGGLVASGGPTPGEVTAVLTDLAAQSWLQVRLRPTFCAASAWPAAAAPDIAMTERSVHVLDLTGGMDAVWSHRFSSGTRRGLRIARARAESGDVHIDCGNSPNLVAAFYDLYLRWVDRRARARGVPVLLARHRAQRAEPVRKFEVVARTMGPACRIRVARVEGRPVAATITLLAKGTAVYWRGHDDRAIAGPLRVPDLLHLAAIEEACAAGCLAYEMGESGGVASLERNKAKFGARPHQIAEYHLERLPLTRLQKRLGRVTTQLERALSTRRGPRSGI
jgi:hypothetical protein